MRLSFSGIGLLLALLWFSTANAQQDSIQPSKRNVKNKMTTVAKELQESLSENDELKIAQNYEKLAAAFEKKGDDAKAESYLKRALSSYTKLKRTSDKTRVTRNLAKLQESQKKYDDAIQNYEMAGANAADKSSEKINENDAKRLKTASTKEKEVLVQENIGLLERANKTEEVSDAYIQKAENSLKQEKKDVAIENYKQAMDYASEPKKVIAIKNEMAKVYVSDNQFDKAISISEKLLEEARAKNDFDTQITQLQSLASIYFKNKESEKAITSLKNAYELATEKGNTAAVKSSLSQLLSYYKANGNDKETMALYDKFFNNFDRLIQADTSLIDAKTFQITEEKIKQLEKEKVLKDELISKKSTFNYFLIGSIVLLLLLFGFIIKALYAIKTKNKKIALQSLRREMNPHFIFNSLNSVNQFISQNKELEANKYLTSYSNLMRNAMKNSNKDFVTLGNEISHLKKYLDLEHMRFEDHFEYKISVDENLDTETVFVPNMIIQPHLENAIWHGLRYLDHRGLLLLSFVFQSGKVIVTIDDNGIGLTKSSELKTKNQKVHESRGLTNTKERIALLNEIYKQQIAFDISEKVAPQTGTIVKITFPLIDKI